MILVDTKLKTTFQIAPTPHAILVRLLVAQPLVTRRCATAALDISAGRVPPGRLFDDISRHTTKNNLSHHSPPNPMLF